MATIVECEFRTVIEDARTRHAAVVALIYATDAQAMSLLRLYVTLGIATASGALAGLGHNAIVARPTALALLTGTLILVGAAGFCLRALKPSFINLPGRPADFWEWAVEHDISTRDIASAYLQNLAEKGAQNNKHNKRAANALKWAKRCGAVVPLGMLLAGASVAFLAL